MRMSSVVFKIRISNYNILFFRAIYRSVYVARPAVTLFLTRTLINFVSRPSLAPVMNRQMGNSSSKKNDNSSETGAGTNNEGRATRNKVESEEKKNRDFYMTMPLEEKRNLYKCKNKYFTIDQIQAWPVYAEKVKEDYDDTESKVEFDIDQELNMKVSLWKGDITALEIDAIVNAANTTLLGGGGVDGCIHRAAGRKLVEECAKLKGCPTGKARLTGGYKLPAKYIIHTAGPIGINPTNLQSCYKECLKIAKDKNIRTLAFPCISTGIYGYDVELATPVVMATVKEWLQTDDNCTHIDKVIFCVFLSKDVEVYEKNMLDYFPVENPSEKNARKAAKKANKKDSKKTLKTSKKEQKDPDGKNSKNEENARNNSEKNPDDKRDEADLKNLKKTDEMANTKVTRSALKESNAAQVKIETDSTGKTEDVQAIDGEEKSSDNKSTEKPKQKVSMSLAGGRKEDPDEDTSPAAKKRPPAEGVGAEPPQIVTKV
ncbi:ADP-ribose glycohydrolase MACROD2-like [Mya arenaria]|uniref:ADP-ribose glycohydrolase MACROD2-like n=1 Tax=Mya arenaria TaxID=6604 RepID=UPI0022E63979|nr:ADP-ribose glycohydrolase MACROD2-like [Mya arenaria]